MAGLRKLKGSFYARIFIPQSGGLRAREKLIPLHTESKVTASQRKRIVEDFEPQIKDGEELNFPWQNGSGSVEVRRLVLEDAVSKYLKVRKGDGLRTGTLDIYENALNHFEGIVGKRYPVDQIRLKHIEDFKTKFIDELAVATLNMYLRAIKTFLIWLHDNELIKTVPRIKMLNAGKSLPIYVSNSEFTKILKHVDIHYQKAFRFYRETGCRLAEPFHGVLNGDFLTIEADTAKGHATRDIYLSPEQKQVVLEIRAMVAHKVEKGVSTERWAIKRYSRVFQDACVSAEIKGRKFHSLRHTFAVRCYLSTRDIYQVARTLGHSSVTTTEIYAKFDIKRLQQDFPDLVTFNGTQEGVDLSKFTLKGTKIGESDTELTDTGQQALA